MENQDYDFEYASIMSEMYEEEKRIAIEERCEKNIFKQRLRGLINVTGLYRNLNENDHWLPLDIVSIELTDEKKSGYPNYQCARIPNDEQRILYLRNSCSDIRGIDHYYVFQRCEMEDSYNGYLLYPLKNGQYLKCSFSC